MIKTSDRATTINLLQELNGYAVGIGIVNGEKTVNGIKTIKIKTGEKINIGYLKMKNTYLSEIAKASVTFCFQLT